MRSVPLSKSARRLRMMSGCGRTGGGGGFFDLRQGSVVLVEGDLLDHGEGQRPSEGVVGLARDGKFHVVQV